jgi:hypothetical protein
MADQAETAVENPEAGLLEALNDAPEEEQVQAEAEDGAAPEEEAEGEEKPEEKPQVDQKFRVKVKSETGEDEERDLSLEELAAGYMQSADYTRKTQAPAAEAKTRQEEVFKAVQQTTQQAQQQLSALQALVVQAAAPELQNVNWQQLAAQDPARYVQLQAKQQQLSQVLGVIQHENQRLEQERQAVTEQQREQAKKHSLDYLSKELPGVNLEKIAPKLVDTGKKYGFTEAEVRNVIDGRALHLLHDAMQWRELQSGKPKVLQKVADAPRVVKPAAPQQKRQNQSALDRLSKTGRAEELVNFL